MDKALNFKTVWVLKKSFDVQIRPILEAELYLPLNTQDTRRLYITISKPDLTGSFCDIALADKCLINSRLNQWNSDGTLSIHSERGMNKDTVKAIKQFLANQEIDQANYVITLIRRVLNLVG